MWRKFCSLILPDMQIRIASLPLLFLICINTVWSQTDTLKTGYYLNKKRDIIYGSASILSFGTFYYLQHQVKPLSIQEVNSLNPSSIPSFDRVATHHYDITARKLSNILIYTSFLARLGIFYNKKSRSALFDIGVVGYQSIFLSQAIANGFKLALRNRPYMYNPNVPMHMKTESEARFSFFSAHTTTVSTICFTTAFAYDLYYPNSKYKNLMWASAITLPALEGFLRVKAGKHYPSDVLTGYLVGLGTSYLMHKLHLKKQNSPRF